MLKHTLAVFLCCGHLALGQGTVVVYSGGDPGAGPKASSPNTDAAVAAFLAAASLRGDHQLNLLDFESTSRGAFASLDATDLGVAGIGLTETGGSNGDDLLIANENDVLEGFNTTSGGRKFLQIEELGAGEPSVGVTFLFDAPIVAFGGTFTGLDDSLEGLVRVTFNDGLIREFFLGDNTGGGPQFWGFTVDDPTQQIRQISLLVDPEFDPIDGRFENSDVIGIDDVYWVVVPEPGVSALATCAVLLLALRRRRQEERAFPLRSDRD